MPAETPASKPTSAESQSVLKPRKRMTRMGLLAIAVSVACGTFGGVGAFTFGYGEGAAYLSNNPASCANCHVMQAHYDSWLKSSHENVATCNDCHLPHHPLGKWITKADNGFFHSLAFTTGDFHEPIQIKQRNRTVTQQACLHCHSEYVNHMLPAEPGGDMLMCIHCHSDVGHSQR
ncbi:MAG: cytochrome c nitrite reductase small subunit [Phycisphaerales bacterium]|nr:cytochrome c nitrite reductase small subunit [Phycisphaerales bacterium]